MKGVYINPELPDLLTEKERALLCLDRDAVCAALVKQGLGLMAVNLAALPRPVALWVLHSARLKCWALPAAVKMQSARYLLDHPLRELLHRHPLAKLDNVTEIR